jgi:Tol biopolymer transport system component
VALILAVFLARTPAAVEPSAMRFMVSSSEAYFYFDLITGPSPAISPNGRLIAFRARRPGATSASLWVRSLDSLDARELRGTEGAVLPFWSPDSQYVGFATSTRLQKIDVSAGVPQTICILPAAADFLGASWNKEDIIVFGAGRGPLMRVPAAGGAITPVTMIDASRGQVSHRHPYFLPDNRHFLYLAGSTVFAGSLDAEPPKELVASDAKAIYAPPGFLLYVSQSEVLARPFDVVRLELRGESFRVAEDVAVNVNQRLAAFSVSETGTLVYRAGGRVLNDTQLGWFDRTGKPLGLVGDRGPVTQFSLSPDDRRVAIERPVPGPEDDIWILELANGALTRFTFDALRKSDPVWSPDSKAITFNKNRQGQTDLFQKVVGSSVETLLSDAPGSKGPDDWSADGKLLLYQSRPTIFVLPAAGDRKPIKVADIPGYADEPHFSPDMHWIAYSSDESGRNEIYVASFPTFEGKRQVSVGGGAEPRWRSDGSELFYLNLDRMLMSVRVKTGAALDFEPPKMLFQTSVRSPTQDLYAVARDGSRFLIGSNPDQGAESNLTVVVNWPAGSKQ